jgi:CTP synthase (UTP-ammonia lyase)
MIEYARNVLGITEAHHEEYDSNASVLFIKRLSCSLAGKTMSINIKKDSQAYQYYQKSEVEEDYYCNFSINPEFKECLEKSELVISGIDKDNEFRIIELPENRFFMATLFVPHSRVMDGKPHPIIRAFVKESTYQVMTNDWR